jgi:hypothetical protein
MSKRLLGWAGLALMAAYCASGAASVVHAESPLQSSNYRFEESTLGAGGLLQSSSANYQASSTTGDLAVGSAASTNYQVNAGSKTTNDPALSFTMNSSGVNFGSFTPSSATVTTANFSISNYTSYGYVVQIMGSAPTNGSHTITPMATTATSQAGTEQFGMNIVANTSPVSFGANPNNGQFGFGAAAPNYGTSNRYRYVSGETIATAPKSSGETIYTLSYLINVGSLTPGGKYTSNQTLIVTGTY